MRKNGLTHKSTGTEIGWTILTLDSEYCAGYSTVQLFDLIKANMHEEELHLEMTQNKLSVPFGEISSHPRN